MDPHDELLKRLVVERDLSLTGMTATDFQDWATTEVASEKPHPLSFDLFSRGCNVHEALGKIAEERLNFSTASLAGDRVVLEIATEHFAKFLNEETTPLETCHVIAEIYSYYVDLVHSGHPMPNWVYSSYNACDWCDSTWTQANSPHLVNEVREIISGKGD